MWVLLQNIWLLWVASNQGTVKPSCCRFQTLGQSNLIILTERNSNQKFVLRIWYCWTGIFRQGSYIIRYSIVAMREAFYIFGGDSGPSDNTPSNTIATFSTMTKKWEKLGELNQARYANGVFIHQGDFIVAVGSVAIFILSAVLSVKAQLGVPLSIPNSTVIITTRKWWP